MAKVNINRGGLTMVRKCGAALVAVICTSMPAAAQQMGRPADFGPAQPNQAPFDSKTNRHFGFYIRPDIGPGYMTASETASNGTTVTISGFSGLAGVAIGGALAENHILAVHIIDAVATNPNVSLSTGASAASSNTQMTLWGIGPEYTYYFMPNNLYLSATLALTRMSLSNNGRSADTNWGLGSRAALGKEWWVSDHWGLGLAGHLSFSSNQDPAASGTSYTLTTWAAGLVFSATYN